MLTSPPPRVAPDLPLTRHFPLVSASEDADAAGINYLRVPIGVTDFSYNREYRSKTSRYSFPLTLNLFSVDYTWDDVSNDTSFESFSLKNVPSEVFNILQDIVDINPGVKLHLCPWTPVRAVCPSSTTPDVCFVSQRG